MLRLCRFGSRDVVVFACMCLRVFAWLLFAHSYACLRGRLLFQMLISLSGVAVVLDKLRSYTTTQSSESVVHLCLRAITVLAWGSADNQTQLGELGACRGTYGRRSGWLLAVYDFTQLLRF